MNSSNPTPEEQRIAQRMLRLGLYEKDLSENFILGSGSGGQKINKTHHCVQLIHHPSGIEIRCQSNRSQARNRLIARQRLCDEIFKRRQQEKLEKARVRALKRSIKRKPGPAAKARKQHTKQKRSQTKALRRTPGLD